MAKGKAKPEQKEESGNRDANGRFVPGCKPLWSPPIGNDFASKYKEEYCEYMIDFFSNPPCAYPTFSRFAVTIGVSTRTLIVWRETYERFSLAYDMCLDIQRSYLEEGGVTRAYDSSLVKFLLSATHGYTDKTAVDVGNADDKPFEVNISVVDKVGG